MRGVSGIPKWEQQNQRPQSKSVQDLLEEQYPFSWIVNHTIKQT